MRGARRHQDLGSQKAGAAERGRRCSASLRPRFLAKGRKQRIFISLAKGILELSVPGGDAQGQRVTGCPGGVWKGDNGVAHLQKSLSILSSIWKKQVRDGSSGRGGCSPRAAMPSRPAASSTAPSGFILPCGDRGTERVSPTGRAVAQRCAPSTCWQPQHPPHHAALQPPQKKPTPGKAHPSTFIFFSQFHIINPNCARNELCFLLLPRARRHQIPARRRVFEGHLLPTSKEGASPAPSTVPGRHTSVTSWASQ